MTYYEDPLITDWQKQIIYGTIIGGSSVVKPPKGRNCNLLMRSTNENWIMYKAQELKDLSSQRPFKKQKDTFRWHSNCYPIFNKFREEFYAPGKKTITMEILDRLRDIGLAVWYGDCGIIKNDKIILNTHRYGQDGSELIARYLTEIDVECSVKVEQGHLHRIVMTPAGSKEFLAIIAPCLPDFMYKF